MTTQENKCRTCGKDVPVPNHLYPVDMATTLRLCHGHSPTVEERAAPSKNREPTIWWDEWETEFGVPTHECNRECIEDCPYLSVDVKVLDVYDFIETALLDAESKGYEKGIADGKCLACGINSGEIPTPDIKDLI